MVARKRNPSKYNIYTKHRYKELKEKHPDKHFSDLQKLISTEWKQLTPQQQDKYKPVNDSIEIVETPQPVEPPKPKQDPAPEPEPEKKVKKPKKVKVVEPEPEPEPERVKPKKIKKTIERIKRVKALTSENKKVKRDMSGKVKSGGFEKPKKIKYEPPPPSSSSEAEDKSSSEEESSSSSEEEQKVIDNNVYTSDELTTESESESASESGDSSSCSDGEEQKPQFKPVSRKNRFF